MRTEFFTMVCVASCAMSYADPMVCNLAAYKPVAGLTATVADNVLTTTWDGDRGSQVRLRLGIAGGTPTIQDLSVRRGGDWRSLAANVTPEFRVVAGLRRRSNQQVAPLRGLGVGLTNER